MAIAATAADETASTRTPDRNGPLSEKDAAEVRKRLTAARNDRRRFEIGWQECLAFAAGKHWLKPVGRDGRRQLVLPELPKGRVRYTVDELSQYRMTILGELSMDADRPTVAFRQEDEQAQDVAEQINDVIGYGWETEWLGDEVLLDVKRFLIDLGTAAVRCRFDKTAGKILHRLPLGQAGELILDEQKLEELRQTGMLDGRLPKFKTLNEGRIRLDPGSPFNLLPPPGVKRERDFPWEGWVEAVHVSQLAALYPDAKGVKPDQLADVNQLSDRELSGVGGDTASSAQPAKLPDHVLVFSYYERPCQQYPKGRVVVLAGEQMRVVDVQEQLPYVAPDGTYRSGIHYFHYFRLSDRFWSRGVIEGAMDPQRAINKRRSQIQEIIDRSLPKVYMARGAIEKKPTGLPLEVVYVDPSKPKPVIDNGPGVNQSLFQDVEALREDLQRATGVHDPSIGENPQGVGNYSQLALLREQDGRKLDPVVHAFKQTVVHVVEDVLYDIRRYWPEEKQIAISGPDGQLRAFTFEKQKLPDFYKVSIPQGAAKPRTQAAMLKMVDDIATYGINAGQPLPVSWVKESYDAGKPIDLPPEPRNDQQDKARYENDLMAGGEQVTVDYFDDHAGHVVEHRSLQIQAKLAGRTDVYDLTEQHVQDHLAFAAQNAQQPPPGAPQPPAGPAGQPAMPSGPQPLAPPPAAAPAPAF